jgi:perosamine synthetase
MEHCMKKGIIQLAKPYIPKEAIEQVAHVLESGHLIQGRWVEEFESALAGYLDVTHVILVSSGTAALHLSLMAMGIREGDEVIIPSFTFPATANVVELLGATPRLVDIGLDDFCIDPELIENSITPRTRAIIPVHEFGQSADLERILEITRRHGLSLIEDAACALGTDYDGTKAGTWGDAGCFSFHPRKTITTGEGGAIATDHGEIAEKVRSLRNHGIARVNGGAEFRYAGLNYRMTDFQAVLGLAQMHSLESMMEVRNRLAQTYARELGATEWIKIPMGIQRRKHSYQTYHLLLDPSIERDKMIDYLKEEGIEANLGAHALHCLPYYQEKYGYGAPDFPKAGLAYRQGLSLPIGQHLTDSDVLRIATTLKGFKDESERK